MQERHIVFWFLLPTNEDASEAIHPTMGAFHDPAPGSFPGFSLQLLRFRTTGTDMSGEAKLEQSSAAFVIIIALVQTEVLGLLLRWLWALHWDARDRVAYQLHVMAIGPRHRQADGHTVAFGQQTAFHACFTAVGGIGTDFFPAQRGFGHRTVQA